jgi:hypothetical protein
MYSHVLQEQKPHTNKTYKQNVHIASRPTINVVPNGALVFYVLKSNIMYSKIDKNIHRNCACIQCFIQFNALFSAYMSQLIRKPSAPFERA